MVAYLVNGIGRIVVVRRSHGDGGGVVCWVAEDGPGDGAHRREHAHGPWGLVHECRDLPRDVLANKVIDMIFSVSSVCCKFRCNMIAEDYK